MVFRRCAILPAMLGTVFCLAGCQGGGGGARPFRTSQAYPQYPQGVSKSAGPNLVPQVARHAPQPLASHPLKLRAVPTTGRPTTGHPATGQWHRFVDPQSRVATRSDGQPLKPVTFDEPSVPETALLTSSTPPALAPPALAPPALLATTKTDAQRPAGPNLVRRYPVNLPTVLRLAGADNWGIQLATERVREARSRLLAARAAWLPSLNAGIGYTKHDGRIQATRGSVIDVSRNSLFLGGGAGLGGSPLAGGSGGPARLQVDLSLADALFKPLAAGQRVRAARANETVTFNDTLLSASLAYYDLVGAQGQLAIAHKNRDEAQNLLKLTKAFVVAGKGSRADTARVRVEVSKRRQIVVQEDLAVKIASAELARILQLDLKKLETGLLLYPLEGTPTAVELVAEKFPLRTLIAQGQTTRPEVERVQAELEARRTEVQAERWRPFIPNLHVGASAGGFGGGLNGNLNGLNGRSDVDILAVWQLKNLGLGQRADRQEKSSRFRQTLLAKYRLRDTIAAEVTKASHQVHAQRQRLSLAATTVDEAVKSYQKNLLRIRGLEGLPLEALAALQAVAEARRTYLDTIIDYDRAQLRLLRSIGRPIFALQTVPPADQNGTSAG